MSEHVRVTAAQAQTNLHTAAVAGYRIVDVFAKVVPQMPAISDLDRLRRAGLGALGVGAGPVPADHLPSNRPPPSHECRRTVKAFPRSLRCVILEG